MPQRRSRHHETHIGLLKPCAIHSQDVVLGISCLALPDGAFSDREDASSYEDNYAILADAFKTRNRWNVFLSMFCVIVRLLGDAREGDQVFSFRYAFFRRAERRSTRHLDRSSPMCRQG